MIKSELKLQSSQKEKQLLRSSWNEIHGNVNFEGQVNVESRQLKLSESQSVILGKGKVKLEIEIDAEDFTSLRAALNSFLGWAYCADGVLENGWNKRK